MTTTKVSSKGQVVIPAEVRKRLGIRKGQHLIVETQGEAIVLRPATKAYFDSLAGIIKTGPSLTKDLLAERARDREREDR
ncbi:MAG: AbrB/MazE/SpoVT family DNA-binding domain-containing protein [Planctomycetota bacterium]